MAGTADTLYIEPFSGMSGDMFLAALLDLGSPAFTLEDLREFAHALVPGEVTLEAQRAWRGSLSGLELRVSTLESERAPHRRFADCAAILERSPLSPSARGRAIAVFRRIGEAEARVHGTTLDQIHFHEVGAVDALIDIGGAAFALERLGVEHVVTAPPVTGTGTVRCAHGELPVPAPGTAEILRGRPMIVAGGGGERLTPTGAALLAEYAERFGELGAFAAERIGYAAGHRDPQEGPPNILRVQLGRRADASGRAIAWLLEVNLDDMAGEEIGFLVQRLRDAGALEAWSSAVAMKKDRPAAVVSALCREGEREALERTVFEHSTTLGLRWIRCERLESARSSVDVELLGRTVRVKRRHTPGSEPNAPPRALELSPEHDDLAAIAREHGIALRELERRAIDLALAKLRG